jgi:hypothetical protein
MAYLIPQSTGTVLLLIPLPPPCFGEVGNPSTSFYPAPPPPPPHHECSYRHLLFLLHLSAYAFYPHTIHASTCTVLVNTSSYLIYSEKKKVNRCFADRCVQWSWLFRISIRIFGIETLYPDQHSRSRFGVGYNSKPGRPKLPQKWGAK